MSAGLYIHVPFCHTRCAFCAFYLRIYRPTDARQYLTALKQEILLHREAGTLPNSPLHSIYLGGGTPTTLSSGDLCDIIEQAAQTFSVTPDAEITIEATPDSVTGELLKDLRDAGVNRISLGAESMDPRELLLVGRRITPDSTRRAVEQAHAAGFDNVNLDLMYGLPGQTCDSWQRTLAEVISLQPAHISCYALTLEAETALEREVASGRQPEPDAELQVVMEEHAAAQLEMAGYERYELSNYARAGSRCRHNLLYWEGGDYLGLGPSAQSYVGGARFGNVANLDGYQLMLSRGELPISQREVLTSAEQAREAVIFGLRLIDGTSAEAIRAAEATGQSAPVARLMEEELIELTAGRIRLTPRGRRFADSIAVELF